MYKNIILTVFLQFLFAVVIAQPGRRPMGIPDLAIKKPESVPQLRVPVLSISSNQTITGITECNCGSACSVLPVKLLRFEGKRIHTSLVKLEWTTVHELNNKGFEVQRSLGNTNDFITIAFEPAKLQGAYKNEYGLPDNNNFSGISYYRLKQLDLDGNSSFSEVVAVKGYTTENSLALYPNPANEKLTADIFSTKAASATILLTDAAQKQVYSNTIKLTKGINIIPIPVAQLGSGLYFMRVITDENKILTAKAVKL